MIVAEKETPPKTRSFAEAIKELRTAAMSSFTSFLHPGNAPSTPGLNPLGAQTPLSTPATQPLTQAQQPSQQTSTSTAVPVPVPVPIIPIIGSYTSASSGSSAATLRFREIAQQSQKLNETIRAGSAELPKLELSLGMIRDKAKDMSRRAGGAGRENMQQA